MKKIAPCLVLIPFALASCTNREILHGSSADKPPSLKMAKKSMLSQKTKLDESVESDKDARDAKEDMIVKNEKDVQLNGKSESASSESSKLTESEKSATVENSEKPVSAERKMRVWFAKESKGSVQPYAVEREFDKKEPLRSAVNQLLEGPSDAERKNGIKSEVPVGTVLISLKKKDNVVELNLSKRFGAGGVDSVETRLQQLSLTIKEVAGHDKVFLDVEGKRLTSAGDGLEVKQPLNL